MVRLDFYNVLVAAHRPIGAIELAAPAVVYRRVPPQTFEVGKYHISLEQLWPPNIDFLDRQGPRIVIREAFALCDHHAEPAPKRCAVGSSPRIPALRLDHLRNA